MRIRHGAAFTVPLPTVPKVEEVIELVWIPPGTFMMGNANDESDFKVETPFQMEISQGFWIGKYPVTQGQWMAVMGTNPSHFQDNDMDCPVENVNWHDAMLFCKELNERSELRRPAGYTFRLPTEGEWEYCCTSGRQAITQPYPGEVGLSDVTWHKGNSGSRTQPVGKKLPNAWNLFDMLGNVMEWCHDSPSDYPATLTVDWVGSGPETLRNVRGGSLATPPTDPSLNCSARSYVDPALRRAWFGFRLCLGVDLSAFRMPYS